MATGRQSKTIRIDAETAKSIEAILAEIPDCGLGLSRRVFTSDEDAALLKHRPRLTWPKISEAFRASGRPCSEKTLAKRYGELMKEKGE